MTVKTCRVCSVRTFPQTATSEEKARCRALGWKRQCGRGVCVNCYERYRKAGRLGELSYVRGVAEQDDTTAKVCTRCGIKHKTETDLCQDCVVIVSDLGELERWAS